MTFTNTSGTRLWTMTEPKQIAGELTGAWVTADHLRSFIYDKDYTYAFHMGVNGMGNMQNTCLLVTDDSTQFAGRLTKHAGSRDGLHGQMARSSPAPRASSTSGDGRCRRRNLDAPRTMPRRTAAAAIRRRASGLTTPRIVPGFHGRLPRHELAAGQPPERPVQFRWPPGVLDTLNVQNTLNGVPIDEQLVFRRDPSRTERGWFLCPWLRAYDAGALHHGRSDGSGCHRQPGALATCAALHPVHADEFAGPREHQLRRAGR